MPSNGACRHGRLATVLDGQDFRRGMSRDLGFTASDRSENMRRAAEVAKVVNDAGVICLTAFVVPHEQVRARARDVIGGSRFLEVYLKAPVGVLKSRDKEGMYAAAERGELPSFPASQANRGTGSRRPASDTAELSVEACAVRHRPAAAPRRLPARRFPANETRKPEIPNEFRTETP